jgi:hypothetical protein
MDPIKCNICKLPNQHFAWVVTSDPAKASAVCRECFADGILFLEELAKFLDALKTICPERQVTGEGAKTIGVAVTLPESKDQPDKG